MPKSSRTLAGTSMMTSTLSEEKDGISSGRRSQRPRNLMEVGGWGVGEINLPSDYFQTSEKSESPCWPIGSYRGSLLAL